MAHLGRRIYHLTKINTLHLFRWMKSWSNVDHIDWMKCPNWPQVSCGDGHVVRHVIRGRVCGSAAWWRPYRLSLWTSRQSWWRKEWRVDPYPWHHARWKYNHTTITLRPGKAQPQSKHVRQSLSTTTTLSPLTELSMLNTLLVEVFSMACLSQILCFWMTRHFWC